MSSTPSQIHGPRVYHGSQRFLRDVTLPSGTVSDDHVAASAAIAVTKLRQLHRVTYAQGDSDDTAVAGDRVAYVARGAGTLLAARFGLVAPCTGNAEVTIDLLVNGSSVLVTPLALDENQSARELVTATLDTPAYSAGDVVEVEVSVDAGSGALGDGLFGEITCDEAAI